LVSEHYRLALQSLRSTAKDIWQCELDIARPQLAAAAGISSDDAAEVLWNASITILPVCVLKDARAGFKQKRYIERPLSMGKHAGAINFMNSINILST
jgi:hypothetical protein